MTDVIDSTKSALVYQGTVITQRLEMLSLTDMWRAAGSPDGRGPSDWRALPETVRFTEFLAETLNAGKSGNDIFQVVRGGSRPGTWGHWQIGLAYAKYLSPEFHMWCNTVVRHHMEGKVAPAHVAVATLDAEARKTIGGIAKAIIGKEVGPLVAIVTALKQEIAAIRDGYDPRVTVTDFVPMIDVLKAEKVLPKKRRALSQRCSRDLLRFCIESERRHAFRLSRETGRYLFQHDAIREWLGKGGHSIISEHKAAVAGQAVLPFPGKPRRSK